MKKIITAIAAFLYLGTSTGAAVNIHYCMGKLADWEFGHHKSDTCSKCGMEKSDGKKTGCCRDEHKFIKNETDQKVVEYSFQLIEIAGAALLPGYTELSLLHISSVTEENSVSNAPPRDSGVAVYIFNKTLLI